MQQKVWVYKDIDEKAAAELASEAGISKLMAKVFLSRGFCDADSVKSFLKPDVTGLYDPFLMNGMDLAVDRILQALDNNESILIYGDYDVDGVVSTAVLYNFLSSSGANVEYFLPDRMEDGYGLTMTAVEKVLKHDAALIVTVDCGITSVDEIELLNRYGRQVIVTDHHECKEVIPGAYAVLNPHKPDCCYPFKELCGAGVTLKLVQAILSRRGDKEGYLKYLDLVALATIADIVPLLGENRIIASAGLKAMENTGNPGLAALIRKAGLGGKPLTSYGVAFGLAPRVNAAGRLGSAERSVRLFTTKNRLLAEALAEELDTENRNRQETEKKIIEEAIQFVDIHLDPQNDKVLVINGEGWHNGVIGIVASKILEKYNRPCIVISVENGVGKGSGRSIKSFNLFKALCFCESLLERFGGHEMAAGLTIKAENIDLFRKMINEYAGGILTDVDLLPCIKIDAFVDKYELTSENVSELMLMAPHGPGNPGPVFGYSGFGAADIRTLSEGKHLKMQLYDGSFFVEAIGFNMGDYADCISTGDALDVVFFPEINRWNGSEKLQLNLRDIKPCIYMAIDKNIVFTNPNDYNKYYNLMQELCSIKGYYRLDAADLVPEKSEFEAVYRYLKACSGTMRDRGSSNLVFKDLFSLSMAVSEKFCRKINYFKLRRIIDIFEELGLLTRESAGQNGVAISLISVSKKVQLEESRIFSELQSWLKTENK